LNKIILFHLLAVIQPGAGNIVRSDLQVPETRTANRICFKTTGFPKLTNWQKNQCNKDPRAFSAAIQVNCSTVLQHIRPKFDSELLVLNSRFDFRVLISSFDFEFRFRVSISSFDFEFRFRVSITSFDFQFRLRVSISCFDFYKSSFDLYIFITLGKILFGKKKFKKKYQKNYWWIVINNKRKNFGIPFCPALSRFLVGQNRLRNFTIFAQNFAIFREWAEILKI